MFQTRNYTLTTVFRQTAPIVLIACLLICSGCTMIGYGIGSGIDSARPKTEQINMDNKKKIKKGKEVTVTLTDSSRIEGVCEGWEPIPDSTYKVLFSSDSLVSRLSPSPGSQVTAAIGMSGRKEGTFVEYDFREGEPEATDGTYTFGTFVPVGCRLLDTSTGRTANIFLNQIRSIEGSEGTVWDGYRITSLAADNRLPLRTALCVQSEFERHYVPTVNVAGIEQEKSRNTRYWLMGIGAAMDIGLILIGIAMQDMEWGLGSGR